MAKKKFYGSLARRIILVGLILVVAPLVVITLVEGDREERAQQEILTFMDRAAQEVLANWVHREEAFLLGKEPEFSSRFALDASYKCTSSTLPEMVGRSDLFPKSVFEMEPALFFMPNPITGRDEVFLLAKDGQGYQGLSLQKSSFFSLFPRFDGAALSIVSKEPLKLSVTSDGDLPLKGTRFLRQILVFLAIGGLGSIWLIRRIGRPMRQLVEVMEATEGEDYSKRFKKDRFGFELNDLGKRFNHTLEAMLHNLDAAKELAIGRELQKELLPSDLPQFPGIEIAGGFIPAKEVGGDVYDLFEIDADRLLVLMGDGSDKGISACLLSLAVRSMLRSFAKSGQSLERMVESVNNLLAEDTADSGNFVTAWIGLYDGNEQKLSFSSAGHLPGILVSPDGKVDELQTKGVALGAIQISGVEVDRIPFEKGAMLFLYTDGLTEAHNEKGELFGKSRLVDFFRKHHTEAPHAIISFLTEEVRLFSNQALQHDDFTMLVVKAN